MKRGVRSSGSQTRCDAARSMWTLLWNFAFDSCTPSLPPSLPHPRSSPADLLYVETRPRKPISWSSLRTVLELTLAPEAVWNSVVRASTEGRQFPSATFSSTWRSSSLSLCGRPLRGRAVVIPPRFHLRMTALTVDRGRFNRAEISRTDFLHRWQPTTVPRWKSLSSSLRPIVPQRSGACIDPSPPPLSQFYFFFYGFWQFKGHWYHHCPLQDRRPLTQVHFSGSLLEYFHVLLLPLHFVLEAVLHFMLSTFI